MTVADFSTIISTVGFPIACCIVMFWQNGKLQTTLSELVVTLEKMNERIGTIENNISKGVDTND